jgi:hypothetical protein
MTQRTARPWPTRARCAGRDGRAGFSRTRMRGAVAWVAAVGVAGLAAPVGVAAVTGLAGAAGCRPAGAQAVIVGRGARVFARWVPRRGGRGRVRAYFGCLERRGRPWRLLRSRWEGGDGYAAIRLAGRWVAYGLWAGCRRCRDSATLVVRQNLRDGRREVVRGDAVDDGLDRTVWDLELARDGAVVWIEEELGPGGREVAVLAARRGAAVDVLDRGPGIVLRSLTLRDGVVGWDRDGERRETWLG